MGNKEGYFICLINLKQLTSTFMTYNITRSNGTLEENSISQACQSPIYTHNWASRYILRSRLTG